MSKPIISIVMPTYNVEPYLPAAIESVIAQTLGDWELLVVDDGSTDASNAVAQRYAANDHRIKVLKKENGGLSDARNYGLERAQGQFVHFFDSDDSIEHDFYETLVAAIEQKNDDFVICGFYKDHEQNEGEIWSEAFHCDEIRTPLPKNLSYNKNIYYYAWNKLYRTEFLKKNQLFFEKGLSVIEDVEFFSRVIDCSPSFRCIDYLGYRYQIRKRPTLGNEYSEQLIPSHLRSVSIQCSLLEKFCGDKEILQHDQGDMALSTVQWVLHCLFNYSNYGFFKKYNKVKEVINDDNVQHYIKDYKTTGFVNGFMKVATKNKWGLLIAIFYSLRKKLLRQ